MNIKNLLAVLVFLAVVTRFGRAEMLSITTGDGLTLRVDSQNPSIQQIEVEKRVFSAQNATSGFMFYDAASGGLQNLRITQFASLAGIATQNGNKITQSASDANARLSLDVTYEAKDEYIQVTGTLRDTSGTERAVILAYNQRFDSNDAVWWRHARTAQTASSGVFKSNTYSILPGWDVKTRHSEYPFSVLTTQTRGLSYAVDVTEPRVARFEYDADADDYYVLFDFGLSPLTVRVPPSTASFSFLIYRTDAFSGFRDAAQKYYSFFPSLAQERTSDEGNCLTMNTRIVPNLASLHFKFEAPFPEWFNNEAENVVRNYNGPNGIRTAPYFIWAPSHSIGMTQEEYDSYYPIDQNDAETIYNQRIEQANQQLQTIPPEQRLPYQMNSSIRSSTHAGTYTPDGRQVLIPNDQWYGQGIDVITNFDPELPDGESLGYSNFANLILYQNAQYQLGRGILPYFDYWGNRGVNINGGTVDVLWLYEEPNHEASHYNCRSEHYAYSDAPLTFEPSSRKPCIFNDFSYQEFFKRLRQEFDSGTKLLSGADYGSASGLYAPYIDVFTTEQHDTVMPDAIQNNRRFYSYHKPFCTYYNPTFPYAQVSHEDVEKYIKATAFYGIYPSMFESVPQGATQEPTYYWTDPTLNNRDASLWDRYIPLIIGLNTAGWEPNTRAVSTNENVFVERFGPTADGTVYFTVANKATSPQSYRLKIALTALGMATPTATVTETISGAPVTSFMRTPTNSMIISDSLNAGDTKIFKITR